MIKPVPATCSTRPVQRRSLAAWALLAIAATCPGCYERVVSSKGVGAQEAQPGYRSNTMLDRAYDDLTGAGQKSAPSRAKVGAFRGR